MSTTGISLLQSHEQGIAWCTPRHCHADAFPSRCDSGWRADVSPRGARGNATRRPAFGVATGHRSHEATMPQATRVPVMQPGCCQGSMFHPDRG
jgi:hypothetical protein